MNTINYYFSDELVYALGWTVVHSLWQGMLIALLMALALIAMPKQRANLRNAIANTALLFILISAVGTFFYLYQESGGVPHSNIIVIENGSTLLSFEHHDNVMHIHSGSSWTHFFADYFNQHLPMIVSIWLLGMLFFALRLLGSVAYVQHLRWNNTNQKLNVFWQKKVDQLKAELHLAKAVEIVESHLVKVPMVIGYIKPMILMPIGAVNALSTEEVEAILAHELAHIARNDYLLNIFQSIVEVLFYFNPAVWWVSANIRSERENSCDDIAIRVCGNPLAYAKALVKIQEMYQPAPNLAMSFAGQKNQLLNRVKRVLNQPQKKSNILEKAITTMLLLLMVIVFSLRASDLNSTTINTDDFANANTFELDSRDTIPNKRSNGTFNYHKDGEEISIELEDNQIIYLKINGEEIPNDDIPRYQKRIEQVINSIPEPPTPPSFDDIPSAPPAPPTPPSIHDIPVAPPAPPAPPSIGDLPVAPPAPPAPPVRGKVRLKKITKDGKTIIIIEEDDRSGFYLKGKDLKQSEQDAYWASVAENELQVNQKEIALQNSISLPFAENSPQRLRIENNEQTAFPIPKFSLILDTVPIEISQKLEAEIEQMKKELNQSLEEYRSKAEELATREIELKKELLEKYKDEDHEELKAYMDDFRQIKEELKTQLKENTQMEIEQMQELKERMLEEKQHMLEDIKIQQEEQQIIEQEMRQQQKEAMQHQEEARRNQMEFHKQQAHVHVEHARANNGADVLIEALVADGIITNKDNFSISFSNEHLKVNKKTLSRAQWKKYKKVYEDYTKKDLSNSKIEISRKRGRSSSSISIEN